MVKKVFCLVVMSCLSVGCVTSTSLYKWGNYEDNLFNYYHKPAVKEKAVADHLEFLAKLEHDQQRPAPGLLAEAGTLLLLQGDTEKAIEFYQKEYETWPESQELMGKLIANLKERK